MAQTNISFSESVSISDSLSHYNQNIIRLDEGGTALIEREEPSLPGSTLDFDNTDGIAFAYHTVQGVPTFKLYQIFARRHIASYPVTFNPISLGIFSSAGVGRGAIRGLTSTDQQATTTNNKLYFVRANRGVQQWDVNIGVDSVSDVFTPSNNNSIRGLTNLRDGELFAFVTNTQLFVQGVDRSATEYNFTRPSGYNFTRLAHAGNRIIFAISNNTNTQIRSIDFDIQHGIFYNPLTLATNLLGESHGIVYHEGYVYLLLEDNLYRYKLEPGVAVSDAMTIDTGKKAPLADATRVSDALKISNTLTTPLTESTSISDSLVITIPKRVFREAVDVIDKLVTSAGIARSVTSSDSSSDSVSGTAGTPTSKTFSDTITISDFARHFFSHLIQLSDGQPSVTNRATLTGSTLQSRPSAIAYHESSGKLFVTYNTSGTTNLMYSYDYNKTTGVLSNATNLTNSVSFSLLQTDGMTILGNTILVLERPPSATNRISAIDYDTSTGTLSNYRILSGTDITLVTGRSLTLFKDKYLVVSDANRDVFDVHTFDLTNDTITRIFTISTDGLHSGDEVIRASASYNDYLVFAELRSGKIYHGKLDIASQALLETQELDDTGVTSPQGFTFADNKLLLVVQNPLSVVSWDYTPQTTPLDEIVIKKGKKKLLPDTTTISDALSFTRGYLRSIANTLSISDAISLITPIAQSTKKTLTDTISASDNLLKGIKLRFSDTTTTSDAVVRFNSEFVTLVEGKESLTDKTSLTGDDLESSPRALTYHVQSGKILVGYSPGGSNDSIYSYDYDASAGTISNGTELTHTGGFSIATIDGITIVGDTIIIVENTASADRFVAFDYNSSSNALSNQRILTGTLQTGRRGRAITTFANDSYLVVSDPADDTFDIYSLNLAEGSVALVGTIDIPDTVDNPSIRAITSSHNRIIFGNASDDDAYSAYLNINARTLTDVVHLGHVSDGPSPEGMVLIDGKLLIIEGNDTIQAWTHNPHLYPDSSLTATHNNVRPFAEALGKVADVLAAKGGVAVSFANTINISDRLGTDKGTIIKELVESISISDALDVVKVNVRKMADAISTSTVLSRLYTSTRNIAQSISSSDVVAADSARDKTLQESTSVSDALQSGLVAARRVLTESISMSSVLVIKQAITRTITETLSISDQLRGIVLLTLNRTRLSLSFKKREYFRLFRLK